MSMIWYNNNSAGVVEFSVDGTEILCETNDKLAES